MQPYNVGQISGRPRFVFAKSNRLLKGAGEDAPAHANERRTCAFDEERMQGQMSEPKCKTKAGCAVHCRTSCLAWGFFSHVWQGSCECDVANVATFSSKSFLSASHVYVHEVFLAGARITPGIPLIILGTGVWGIFGIKFCVCFWHGNNHLLCACTCP